MVRVLLAPEISLPLRHSVKSLFKTEVKARLIATHFIHKGPHQSYLSAFSFGQQADRRWETVGTQQVRRSSIIDPSFLQPKTESPDALANGRFSGRRACSYDIAGIIKVPTTPCPNLVRSGLGNVDQITSGAIRSRWHLIRLYKNMYLSRSSVALQRLTGAISPLLFCWVRVDRLR